MRAIKFRYTSKFIGILKEQYGRPKVRESMIQVAWSKYLEYLTQQLLKYWYKTCLACPRTKDGQTVTHLY